MLTSYISIYIIRTNKRATGHLASETAAPIKRKASPLYHGRKVKSMKQKFIDIPNEVIRQYRIDICDGTKCDDDWRRTHAHVKKRRVCKWKQKNSIASTFTLFHEIGHIETNKCGMRRCEEEYHATVWAIEKCKEYSLEVPTRTINEYQDYINEEYTRGIRRHGILPPLKKFQLTV